MRDDKPDRAQEHLAVGEPGDGVVVLKLKQLGAGFPRAVPHLLEVIELLFIQRAKLLRHGNPSVDPESQYFPVHRRRDQIGEVVGEDVLDGRGVQEIGNHQNRNRLPGRGLPDPRTQTRRVHIFQLQVGEDEIGPPGLKTPEDGLAPGLRDDLETRRLQHRGSERPHLKLAGGDQHQGPTVVHRLRKEHLAGRLGGTSAIDLYRRLWVPSHRRSVSGGSGPLFRQQITCHRNLSICRSDGGTLSRRGYRPGWPPQSLDWPGSGAGSRQDEG